MIDALQTAALQQQSRTSFQMAVTPRMSTSVQPSVKRVTAGQVGVLTPQCHRCHHRKVGRGFASCENGLAHHFCERCVHNSFGTDFQQLVDDPASWSCPVCNCSCPCAACERRSSNHNNNTGNPVARPSLNSDPGGAQIKKGWSESDASMLVSLVHQHQAHKNKWKLVAAAMPDARTPGQVKEKYHRMQKLPEFKSLQAKLLQSPVSLPSITEVETELDAPNSQTQKSAELPSVSSTIALMRSAKSASGFRGVSRAGSRWEAYIGNGTAGKRYIGRFDTPREAAIAYAQAYAQQPKQAGTTSPMEQPQRGGSLNINESGRVYAPCKRRRASTDHCRVQQKHKAPSRDAPSATQSPHQASKSNRRGMKHRAPDPDEHESPASSELIRSSKAASGYMGVAKAGCRWEAYVSAGARGKRFKRYIGCYDTPQLAAQAYLEATRGKNDDAEEEQSDDEDVDERSQEWVSDEGEEARNQVIHVLSSLPSVAMVANETPPSLELPAQQNDTSCIGAASSLLSLQVLAGQSTTCE